MQNLEQVRAHNALQFANRRLNFKNVEGGEVVSKIPSLILNHGLMAVAAWAYDKKLANHEKREEQVSKRGRSDLPEQEGWGATFDALAQHLADSEIQLAPAECKSVDALLGFLSEKANSESLKQCTIEAQKWLGYAKRFVR